jgi:ribosomal protein S18 acetylase RimI-like enzyme
MQTPEDLDIRPVRADDEAFILGLVARFVSFELPAWRDREESAEGVRRDLLRHLRDRPDSSHIFVAETPAGVRAGFLHLQTTIDFFTGAINCHISDVAVAPAMDGRGIGGRLLEFAEDWARGHGCRFMTLGVFPGNARARRLYERYGYGVELLRMAKPVS